jgi:uncharacterized tellurite resistance protein B-like protein
MSYTNIERQAIIKLLSDMMMVDGHSDQQEKQYLEYVKNLLGLPSVPFDSTMDRNRAFSVISNMNDDQKMEVAGMLQQMIMADGIQDKNEMYFWGEIVTYTGIDKAIERKTAGMNSQYDDAQIYLNASKISLSKRTPEYLSVIEEQARNFKEMFSNYFLTIDDKCDLILEYTRQSVKGSGWDLNDVDGVTWFIGNFTDAMVKSGTIDDYDAMFVKCFKKYFNL